MKKLIVALCAFHLVLAGCEEKKTNLPPKEKVALNTQKLDSARVETNLVNLEKEMFAFQSPEDAAAFLRKHPLFVDKYLELPNAADEAPFVKQLYDMYSNPTFKEFYKENEKSYGNYSDLRQQLNDLFSLIKYYYPDYYVPEVNTVISGFRFDRDFAFSDSLIVISIDYFLGSEASYRPQFYDYMLKRYEKPYIVPMVGLAISSKFNEYNPADETMLSEMIHYGKAHYFLERVMPNLPDSLNIQYTAQEMEEIDKNIDIIWGHFLEKKLLFDNNHKTKQRYVGESPKVVAIGENCPGRIGRWLGWQIVRKYMREHPEVTLPQLMQEKNAQELFKKSNFKIKATS
jgi:gliding motility-associated lipoprotein GldB